MLGHRIIDHKSPKTGYIYSIGAGLGNIGIKWHNGEKEFLRAHNIKRSKRYEIQEKA